MERIDTMAQARERARRLLRTLGIVDSMAELRAQLRVLEDPESTRRVWAEARMLAPALVEELKREGAQLDAEVARLRLVCASGAPEVRS